MTQKQPFEATFVSHENGIRFTVEDKMTASLLSNSEKKNLVYFERDNKNKGEKPKGKGKLAAVDLDSGEQTLS